MYSWPCLAKWSVVGSGMEDGTIISEQSPLRPSFHFTHSCCFGAPVVLGDGFPAEYRLQPASNFPSLRILRHHRTLHGHRRLVVLSGAKALGPGSSSLASTNRVTNPPPEADLSEPAALRAAPCWPATRLGRRLYLFMQMLDQHLSIAVFSRRQQEALDASWRL